MVVAEQRRTTWLLGAALALTSAATGYGFELDDVLGAPYPGGLAAAAGADRIAWVEDDRGIRSLWTAAAPGFEPVRLTGAEGDDGQPLGSLELTADGAFLIYVRGGRPNVAGEHPNPAGDPDGAGRAIWAVATGGGEPWKVAEGGAPAVSPTGGRVAFARGSAVFTAELTPPSTETPGDAGGGSPAGAPASEARELFQARGRLGALSWSPDGRRLAFVSDRDDHGFVGVYDLGEDRITWMAPDVERDGDPVFSADGSRLAFLRFAGRRTDKRADWTSSLPFAVMVGDPATGEAREVWRSPGADGGFPQSYPPWALEWAGERLIFVSEHEGWMHLYAVPASGGAAADLTPGEGEVEAGALSPDGSAVYFCGNHGDRGRRHLWRVPTGGGAPRLLTPGRGIETDPTPLSSGRYLAFRGADARRPQRVAVLDLESGSVTAVRPPLPPAFPAAELVEPREVTFEAADGLAVGGPLFLPRGSAPGDGRPAVVFLHGGPVRQMLLGWHYSHYYARAYAFNQYLASRGYVVLALNFRAGIGHGRAFRQAPGQGRRGATEYRDLLAAGRYLRRRPEVNPERIGLWGGSYGGYLTALGLARDSDLFAAGVDLHGVHDWTHRADHFPARGRGRGFASEGDRATALSSSPVADLRYWSSPVLFVHGDDDRNVLFAQTTDLVQRLKERPVQVETLVLPDEVHGFLRHESWLRTFRAAAGFFERFLEAP